MKSEIRNFLQYYHDYLTQTLTELDGAGNFSEDAWEKSSLGFGRTRVMRDGALFEQAGVSYSDITGSRMPKSLLGQYPELDGQKFWGAGVSMVLHPKNPYCPTAHLNFRYFEAGPVWWFGGGCDLTPYYPEIADCQHWHNTFKQAMDRHEPQAYPAFKYWCDEYFYNHHRHETRGIGGIFYDYQTGKAGELLKSDMARKSEQANNNSWVQASKTWSEVFAFQHDVAFAFLRAYLPIIAKYRDKPYGEREREFQLYRRGRYVEFNLLHDRGTLFGLQSNGRVESILMSMPPLARWEYCLQLEPGSPEQELTEKFLHRGIDWAAM